MTAVALLLLVARAPAQTTPPIDEEVTAAIRLIVDELYERHHTRTHWEEGLRHENADGRHDGGQTALVVLALLYAGESPQTPALAEAIEYLTELSMTGVYARSIRAGVWAQLPPKYLPLLQADATWLMDAFSRRVDGWTYTHDPNSGRFDNSTTQYGALGLWEAAKRGIAIPPEYWRRLEERFITSQLEDGGWQYQRSGPPRGSMTAAGLTVLYIARDLLHSEQFERVEQGWAGRDSVASGLDWFASHFDPAAHPGYGGHYTYYLYGVERVGLASGAKYFGERDWYRDGAAALIDFLTVHDGGTLRIRAKVSTVDLAFGLMFLSRGRAPVIVNKLRDDDIAWNNRPRDAAALARFMSDETEQALNWQVVPITADPSGWLDAPLLYIASHEALPYDVESEQVDKLRDYMMRGGMIVATADAQSRRFGQSVEALATAMFPDARWRKLSADHELFHVVYDVSDPLPEVWGLSNGVREILILLPRGDVGEILQATGGEPTGKRSEIAAYHLLSNIVHYASGLEPFPQRLAGYADQKDDARPAASTVRITKVRYDGNCDPELAALTHFAQWMHRHNATDVTISEIALDELAADAHPRLVVMTGVEAHMLTTRELRAIETYIRAGGTILVETAGGVGEFSRSVERQLSEQLGARTGPLARHAIVTGKGVRGAGDCRSVAYTPSAALRFGAGEHRPRLRGLALDGDIRVIFSHEDLTHALLGRPVWGVCGYDTDSARRLLRNIVAYAR